MVIIIVAALNLALDFDFIERAVGAGAPRYMEWTGALGITVTLVWIYEAFLVLFVALTAFGLRGSPFGRGPVQTDSAALIWGVGGGIALLLLVLSRLTRRPAGIVGGTLAQVVVVATGLVVPLGFVVNIVFAVMWVMALRLGSRVDRERAAYDAEHPDTAPNVDTK